MILLQILVWSLVAAVSLPLILVAGFCGLVVLLLVLAAAWLTDLWWLG